MGQDNVRGKLMVLVVAVSGLHGTGKSTYARSIANEFRLRHVSAGELFRRIAAERGLSLTELTQEAELKDEIDRLLEERTRKEMEKGEIVVDGLLAGWVARDYFSLKIYLSAPYDIRIRRIASRDKVSFAEAERVTILREDIERKRFKRFYGIDIDDLSIYDLVLNTSLMSIESNIKVIKGFVKEYLKSLGRR